MSNEPPEQFFRRQDESPDELFYQVPRLTTHIDDATIRAITTYYEEVLRTGDSLLDLMSSWISHLPESVEYSRVSGLGMNEEELVNNPRLTDSTVQNLNDNPQLPYADESFDAVMIVVSIQYLTSPFDVFAEISRVLKPGGQCIVAMSHRLFPTKAIYAFQTLTPAERCQLVMSYMHRGDHFKDITFVDRSPGGADPLWIVRGIA
ncbi:MAG: ubiquinone/menaquinone biosynthesis C-methylase UbiE [Candidatus Azotimanducaceae bacterium]|jgi:ubiquinone/menaquinone biosynthesis C-methylase UbiE